MLQYLRQQNLIEPGKVWVTQYKRDDHGTERVEHSVIWPHEVFSAAHASGWDRFQYMLLGEDGQDGLEDFWNRCENQEWVKKHPAFTVPDLTQDTRYDIPIGCHADKGQHSKLDKILTMSWGSTSCRAATLWAKFMFTIILDAVLIKGTTDEELYAAFVWSMWWVMLGIWPHVDCYGKSFEYGSRRWAMAGQWLAGHGQLYVYFNCFMNLYK